jgi:Glucose / Sorbosone dehydrogenase
MRRLFVSVLLLAATIPAASGQAAGYRIPHDNPFVSTPRARGEIYVAGLRNPYRWSFDRRTGDMYVADVGGSQREEITFLPRGSIAGANLGWPCFEGTALQRPCDPPNYFPPTHQYRSGPDVVIGGHVVHDPALPSLVGRYIYGRYVSGMYALGLRASGRARKLGVKTQSITSISEDGVGRLYVTSYDGPVHRLGESRGRLILTKIGDFARPLAVTSQPGDPERLFVVEKRGIVWLLADGRVSKFLDITHLVRDEGYEEGLLGFALAPDYATSGRVFAYYVTDNGDLELDEFRQTAAARRPMLSIRHDRDPYHHGGQLLFGPDGHLYLGIGDGDRLADRDNDAQSLRSLQGKILRLDVGVAAGAALDRTAPRLHARVRGSQRLLRHHGAIAYVRCSESCSVAVRGRLSAIGRAYPLRRRTPRAGPGRRVRMTVRLTADGRRALRRTGPGSLRIGLRARDAVGNRSPWAWRTVRVRR